MKIGIIRCVKGASAVEFAAVCPVLLLFLFAAVYFGLYLSLAHSLQQLSADAARVSIAGLDDAERLALSSTYVAQSADRYFLLNPARVSVEAGPASGVSNAFEVIVRYDAEHLLGWYPQGLPGPGTTITRASVIPNGGI